MALDKQKILSDLGNVMNQLQSADCGCMGKLFSNSGQAQGASAPGYGCHQGCCRNQMYGHPCSGEPYSVNQQGMARPGMPCMGHCNPKQLYSGTYSYLNQNLMQPVVREVYDDLKGICPANTVMNNALGSQLGLAQGAKTPVVRGNMDQIVGQSSMGGGNVMQSMGGMGGGQQSPMGGMGPEIVNMMMGSNKSKPTNMTGQGGQLPPQGNNISQNPVDVGGMGANAAQYGASNMAAYNMQYDSGNMGGNMGGNMSGNMGGNMSGNMGGTAGVNYAQYQTGQMGQTNMGGNTQSYNPTTQYIAQPNTPQMPGNPQSLPHMAGNVAPMSQSAPVGNINANSGARTQSAAHSGNYGQHTAGIAKFKEMFPGVMQGLEGELNFDPMSIALQMNPANQQQVAMKTLQDVMFNKVKPLNENAAAMKPVMQGMNAVNANLNPNQITPTSQNQIASNPNQAGNEQVAPVQNQFDNNPETAATNQQYQMQQQIVNTAISNAPTIQQVPQQRNEEQSQPQNVHKLREGAVELPDLGYPNQGTYPYQQVRKEPIFPADTAKYNTLGQPIEPLPTKHYQGMGSTAPSRSRTDQQKLINVKATISKTSLFGNRPVGKTPSRRQLQQVYNQYKGSLSSTNQNIKPPVQAGPGNQQLTASDGRLNVNQANSLPQRQAPVERTGGDTVVNNQVINEHVANKGDHGIIQAGDIAANKPTGDTVPVEKPMSPTKNARLRNGLQDMVYTAYPQSAAWSFHGHTDRQPIPYYGLRNRV